MYLYKRNVSEEWWIKRQFIKRVGYGLDLKNPKTFNEKLQWLKFHNRKNEYSTMVDKFEVKEYVSNLIGNNYVIPTLGVWNDVDSIDFSSLPKQFVLKCTHDSGSIIICKDKSKFDVKSAKKKLKKWLKYNYYYATFEWPYKNVKPRIIAEKYMEDESGGELKDYKFLCFNGEPKLIEVHSHRLTGGIHTQDIYDMEWKKTKIAQIGDPISKVEYPKPQSFEQMVKFSKILSNNIPHLRVDWYDINGRLYFGELTFYDGAGFCPFEKYSDDLMLGQWMKISL